MSTEKILTPDQAIQAARVLQQQKKRIVLVGGCFDLLHIGHITFLQEAKTQGDSLFVFVESDETIKKLKGPKRPINNQTDRARILAALTMVDYIVILPVMDTDNSYDELIINLKPAIIATTAGDHNRLHKERQAKKIGAKVIDVTKPVSNISTTRLIDILNEL